MSLAYLVSYLIWIFFINDLYAEKFGIKWFSYILTILMIFLQYNFIRCYVSDPGIIPKNIQSKNSQNTVIDIKSNNSKSNKIENAYCFLSLNNNQSKDLNIDIENNISN